MVRGGMRQHLVMLSGNDSVGVGGSDAGTDNYGKLTPRGRRVAPCRTISSTLVCLPRSLLSLLVINLCRVRSISFATSSSAVIIRNKCNNNYKCRNNMASDFLV